MGRVTELVAEYASLLRPCQGTDYVAFAREHEQIIRQFRAAFRRLGRVESEIILGLSGLLTNPDWRHVTLWLHVADECPTSGLVHPLCELLDVRREYLQHEWIAEILCEISSPESVESLSRACSFDVPGDVFRALPKKCMEALLEIGTESAIAHIKSQVSSPWPEVREFAAKLLEEHT